VRDRQTPTFWINCMDFYAISLNSLCVTLLPSYDASEDLDLGSFRTWPEIIPSLHHVRFIPWDLIPPCLSYEFEILQGPARRYPVLSLFPFMSFLPSVYYGESRSCNDVCHPLFLSLGTGRFGALLWIWEIDHSEIKPDPIYNCVTNISNGCSFIG